MMADDEERYGGKIKKWFTDKGIGFISPDDGGSDLFVHHTVVTVVNNGFVALEIGQEVEYSLDPEEKRGSCKRACNVTAPGGEPLKTLRKPDDASVQSQKRRSRSRSERAAPRRSPRRSPRPPSRSPRRSPRPPSRSPRRSPRRDDRPPARRNDSRPEGRGDAPARREDSQRPWREGRGDRRPPAQDDRARDGSHGRDSPARAAGRARDDSRAPLERPPKKEARPDGAPGYSIADEIEKLVSLKERGHLSAKEFGDLKSKLLQQSPSR